MAGPAENPGMEARERGRRPGRTLLVVCLGLVLGCLMISFFLGGFARTAPPPLPRPNPSPSAVVDAAAAGVDLPELQREQAGEAHDKGIVLIVTDALSGDRLDAVRVCFGDASRIVYPRALRPLATTVAGVACLDAEAWAGSSGRSSLVLLHDNYVPSRSAVPTEPGVYHVAMAKGRRVTVHVETLHRQPIPNARVVLWSEGVLSRLDRALWDSPEDPEQSRLSFSVTPGERGWHVATVTGADGVGVATVPNEDTFLVVDRFGWFPPMMTAADGYHALPKDPLAGPATVRLVLEEVRCAVLSARSLRILGQSLVKVTPAGWKKETNTFAFRARDQVREALARKYPGDLILAECLLSPGHRQADQPPPDPPEGRLQVMVDDVGLVEVKTWLDRYSAVTLQTLRTPPPDGTRLGSLVVDALPGYRADWPAPLRAVPAPPGFDKPFQVQVVGFDLCHGESYRVPAGRYAIYRKRIEGTSVEQLSILNVNAGGRVEVQLEGSKPRWPVEFTIRDRDGSTPSTFSLRIRRNGAADDGEWAARLNVRSIVAYLEEGDYEAVATRDKRGQETITAFRVEATFQRIDVAVQW